MVSFHKAIAQHKLLVFIEQKRIFHGALLCFFHYTFALFHLFIGYIFSLSTYIQFFLSSSFYSCCRSHSFLVLLIFVPYTQIYTLHTTYTLMFGFALENDFMFLPHGNGCLEPFFEECFYEMLTNTNTIFFIHVEIPL